MPTVIFELPPHTHRHTLMRHPIHGSNATGRFEFTQCKFSCKSWFLSRSMSSGLEGSSPAVIATLPPYPHTQVEVGHLSSAYGTGAARRSMANVLRECLFAELLRTVSPVGACNLALLVSGKCP